MSDRQSFERIAQAGVRWWPVLRGIAVVAIAIGSGALTARAWVEDLSTDAELQAHRTKPRASAATPDEGAHPAYEGSLVALEQGAAEQRELTREALDLFVVHLASHVRLEATMLERDARKRAASAADAERRFRTAALVISQQYDELAPGRRAAFKLAEKLDLATQDALGTLRGLEGLR